MIITLAFFLLKNAYFVKNSFSLSKIFALGLFDNLVSNPVMYAPTYPVLMPTTPGIP